MNFKSTIVLIIIFGVLFGVYKWDKSKRTKAEKVKEEQAKVMPFEEKDLDHLVLKNNGEEVELQKTGGTDDKPEWQMVRPIKTKADEAQVKSIASSLAGAKMDEPFDLSGKEKLADYGLQDPKMQVEMKSSAKSKVAKLSLGDRKTGMGDFFASLDSKKNNVFLVSSSVQSTLDKKVFDLRDKTVLSAPADDVTSVTLAMGMTGAMKAEKHGEAWTLTQPLKDAGDKVALGDLLRKVDSARAVDFVNTTDTLQLDKYGLEMPSVRLSVWGPKLGKEKALLVGDKQPEEERFYAMQEGGKEVFLIEGDVQKELSKPFESYRSKDLFPAIGSAATQVDVVMGEEKYSIKKGTDGKWAFADASGSKVSQTAGDDLLAAFTDLKVKEFRKADKTSSETLAAQLDKPKMSVTLHAADGKTESADFGKIDAEQKMIFARRSTSDSVLVLEWKDPEQFEKKMEDLTERKVAEFKPEDAASIDVAMATNGVKTTYHFAKQDAEWKGRSGEGEMKVVQELEATSLLNAIAGMQYKKQYAKGDKELAEIAGAADTETTMTLKNAAGKVLFEAGVTPAQMDLRYLHQDGKVFAVDAVQYQPVDDSLKPLLDATKTESKP